MDRAILPQDLTSGNVLIIEPEHGVIHEGAHYTVSYDTTVAGSGSVTSLLITTPAASEDKYLHFVCSVNADKKVIWTLSEAPEATAGSVLTSYNNNRAMTSSTSPATVTANPTITSVGTVLETHIVGSASTNQSKVGGNANARNEWVLAAATKYLLRVVTTEATTEVDMTIPYYYRPQG